MNFISQTKEILISVVIPVKNGAAWLNDCLHSIINQTLFPQTEIIVLDSGSEDNTLEILKKFPVQVLSVAPDDFNHGETRNIGARFAKGKYVVMTVQDAKASDKFWLQHLLDGFEEQDVSAVCGKQVVPHEKDKNPVDWYRPVSKGTIKSYQFKDSHEFEKLSPEEKMKICSWDDVNAMYLKEALIEIPFRKISYGEDAAWALDAILKGKKIVYNPEAIVHHYHEQDLEYTFKRTLTVMYLRYKLFGFRYSRPAFSLRYWIGMVKSILKSKPESLNKIFYWINYNSIQQKGIKKAYNVFEEALADSESELDRVHEKVCGNPPIPLNKNLLNQGMHNIIYFLEIKS